MRRRFKSSCGSSLITLLLLALSPDVARAEDAEAARTRMFREQYERAGRAYNDKDYAAAIPALQAAFAIQPLPQILFNIAQAYRRLEKWTSARIYFELYRSTSPTLSPELTEQLDSLILEVSEAERASQKTQVVERTKVVYVQSEKPLPKWLRPLGITSSLVGLGLIASGAVFLGLDGRCDSAPEPPILECERLYSTKTPGTALAVVGAGVLVVGVVTFGLSLRKPVKPTVRETPPPENQELPALPALPPPDGSEPAPTGWNSDGTRATPTRSRP